MQPKCSQVVSHNFSSTNLSALQRPLLFAWLFFISWPSFHFSYFDVFKHKYQLFISNKQAKAFSRRHFESRSISSKRFIESADTAFRLGLLIIAHQLSQVNKAFKGGDSDKGFIMQKKPEETIPNKNYKIDTPLIKYYANRLLKKLK